MANLSPTEILISFAALLVAITTIYNFFSNLGKGAKNKAVQVHKEGVLEVLDEVLEKRVTTIINKVLPTKLNEHDVHAHEQLKREFKEEIITDVQEEFTVLDELKEYISQLALSAKDVLREKIMGLYHKNRADRTLTENEKEALDVYYKDYKAIGGNSYIDRYYRRMSSWRVIPDTYEERNEDHQEEENDH